MFKKLIFLASFILVLGSASNADDIQWTGLGADNLWSTPENWDLGRVPTLADEVRIDVPAAATPDGPVIQDGIDAKAKGIFTEAAGQPTLTITGGTLEVAEWIWWGDGADSFAVWDMSGGTVTVTDEFELGWGGGAGTLTMTGGTITAGEAVIPTGSGAFGKLYLNGGTYNVTKPGGLGVNATGLIDITEGTLVLEGDDTAKVNNLIASGLITAYGGAGQINMDFDVSNPGKTTLTAVLRVVLLQEDFEGLPLGPNVDEALAGDAVWTETPPADWIVDESGVPGIGDPNTDGVTEWAGWAFADKAWWTQTAGDQDRSKFTLGSGTVAIADPDEWDDADHTDSESAGWYKTYLSSPAIDISGCRAGTVQLKFDSSWRPEFDDDYHQTASITASFDEAAPVVVLLWESDESSANYKPYATNEIVTVDLQNPKGAKSVVLTFGLYDAGNDWWWAIDNVEVSGKPIPEPVNPGTEGLVAHYAFENDVNDSSGNGLNGTIIGDATFAAGVEGMALDLSGNDYVDCGGVAEFSFTNAMTVSTWVNVRSVTTAWMAMVAKGENAWRLGFNNLTTGVHYAFSGGTRGWQAANTATELAFGEWYHVAATYDANVGAIVYINGKADASNTNLDGIDVNQKSLLIGDNPEATGRLLDGMLDEVKIYNRALSEAEIFYLAGYRADTGGEDPSLSIYYIFDEVGDVVSDQSGKGHDGVVVGDVTAEANGMYGGAANLANAGYLDLDGANFPAEDIPTSGFTLATWTNIDGTSSQNAIFNARASDSTWLIHPEIRPGNGDYRFTVRKYGGVTIGNINGDTPGYKKPEGTPVPNEWVHVAMTFSRVDAQVILYVNGEVVAQAAITEDADMAGDWGLGARVGYNIDDARHYTGLMDEFRMYKRALSHDEILAIMQGP
jgi:hypothetical protein